MKDKIISKATHLFLKLGFKSVTMDDIANEMCISKKTIYKYFCNKEILIVESTDIMSNTIYKTINEIVSKNHNAIEENFEIIKMIKEMFVSIETSPSYQLKKHYPEIHEKLTEKLQSECTTLFKQNIEKGIQEGLYRNTINVTNYVYFYYALIFTINENTSSEKEAKKLELEALEYHIRAMATTKGISELNNYLYSNQS
ncbi:MAG: TetR/AcrR family transcriptional regulator [Flavobacterium sp.]|nr:TetR/AcrR family transcriptional regulator [Flavobacterium sp.]